MPDSPPLATTWPATGPKLLWQSEAIPSDTLGGFGSPVVSGGRVYLFVNWKIKTPVAPRKLTENALFGMSWFPADSLTPELVAAMEAARVSDERNALQGDALTEWLAAWPKTHLTEAQQQACGPRVTERLRRGKGALPWEVLTKLVEIKDREFAGQADLDAWFAAAGFTADQIKTIMQSIPVTLDTASDTVLCLDAATGATVWKHAVEGRATDFGSSSTPCLAGGRCYVSAAKGVYCLDAATGAELWRAATQANDNSSSFLVLDGIAIVQAGEMYGFDAATGALRWKQPTIKGNSPSASYWQHGGKTYLITTGAPNLSCVDPQTGAVLWTTPNNTVASATVAGDVAVVCNTPAKTGLSAYRLSLTGAELLWSVEMGDRGVSPLISGGYVYAVGGQRVAMRCVDLQTGATRWEQPFGSADYSSPVLADGKLVAVLDNGGSLRLIEATPDQYRELAKTPMKITRFTTPAVSDGRVYVRLVDAVACYDLTAAP
jgi:outer membrane protein assembly factor BamB